MDIIAHYGDPSPGSHNVLISLLANDPAGNTIAKLPVAAVLALVDAPVKSATLQ